MENSSSFSISPSQHDGYLADSEENADLSSLQAQIQQVRNEAKRQQKRRKEERGEGSRKESKGTQERRTQEERQKKKKESKGRKETGERKINVYSRRSRHRVLALTLRIHNCFNILANTKRIQLAAIQNK